ncbi:hypothetical protein WME75_44310 [Sorangium sp. So ce1014]|uniref:hypothetical protein n=1 Tax=Sorangium sp. So ce1014 TaxID=3133326 RepID=UPI003F5ED2D6
MSPLHRERMVTARESSQPEARIAEEELPPESGRQPAAYTARGGPTGEPWPERAPALTPDEARELSERWGAIQAGFIEAPRQAVEQADALVTEVIQRVMQSFREERSALQRLLDGEPGRPEVSTEELRLALRRYRSLLGRLLAF